MPRARQKQGTGFTANSNPSKRNRVPSETFGRDAERMKTAGYYGFGGAVLEAGFGVVEAGLLAAGLAVVADALAGYA